MRFPRHIEVDYAGRLARRQATAHTLVSERLAWLDRRRDKGDDEDDQERRVRMDVRAVQRGYEVTLPVREEHLLPTATAIDSWATRGTVREVERIVGVDVEADTRIGSRTRPQMRELHLEWARANVDLIKTMDADMFDDVADAVVEQVVQGRADLEDVLVDRFGVARSRAKLIARDQTAKLNGQITQARQQQLGIDAYEWSSSGDQRVRPLHRKLDGTIRRWDQPHPTEGHPGSAIACRCVAIPVVDPGLVPAAPPPTAPAVTPPALIPVQVTPRPARPLPPALPVLPPPPPTLPDLTPGTTPEPPPLPELTPAVPEPPTPYAPPQLDLSQVGTLEYFEGADPDTLKIVLERFFRRPDVTAADVVSLAGVQQQDLGPRTTIEVRMYSGQIRLTVDTPRYHMDRTYKSYPTGNVAEHESFTANYDPVTRARYRGVGFPVFSDAVANLRRLGFTRIDTYAAGRYGSVTYNGYYTWPRFGFEAPLPAQALANLPPDLAHARTLQDLFDTDDGALWWQTEGGSVLVEFDLNPGSRSSTALERYAADRAEKAKRGDAADLPQPWPPTSDEEIARDPRVKGRLGEQPPDLDEDDPEVWAHLARVARG